MNIHSIDLLTIAGKNLWEENDSLHLDHDILESNDLYRIGTTLQLSNITLCEIDTTKTNINDFYKWNEIDLNNDTTFCWKKYYYILGDKNESWLNIPEYEKLSQITVQPILKTIIDSKKVI